MPLPFRRAERDNCIPKGKFVSNALPVVSTGGITQPAGDATSFGFIGISEAVRSLP